MSIALTAVRHQFTKLCILGLVAISCLCLHHYLRETTICTSVLHVPMPCSILKMAKYSWERITMWIVSLPNSPPCRQMRSRSVSHLLHRREQFEHRMRSLFRLLCRSGIPLLARNFRPETGTANYAPPCLTLTNARQPRGSSYFRLFLHSLAINRFK